MKRSITIKFIAVLLCTLSLLGAVASAGSIAVLTEMNLYNKTVEQVRQEQIYSDGAELSRLQALSYASRNLGGCPEELVREIYGDWWFPDYYIQGDSHGYAVLDAEGNVLESVNPELKTTGETHSFPVEGQYLHLVSEMSHSEKYPQTEEAQENLYEGYLDGRQGVVDILPADGIQVAVYNITLGYADESGEGFGSVDPIGMIWRDSSGRVVFQSNQEVFLETGEDRGEITYISFRAEDDTILYEAASDRAVGTVYHRDGVGFFESGQTQSLDIIGRTEVYQVQFYNAGKAERVIFELADASPIGTIEYNSDGHLSIILNRLSAETEREGAISFPVSRASVFDGDGRIIKDHIGDATVTMSEGRTELRYLTEEPAVSAAAVAASRGAQAETAAAETVPETLPVETAAETIPETAPEETAAEMSGEEAMAETAEEESAQPEEGAQEEGTPVEQALTEDAAAEQGNTEAAAGEADAEEDYAEQAYIDEAYLETAYPEETEAPTVPVEAEPAAAAAETEPPELINGKPLSEYGVSETTYYNSEIGEAMHAQYIYLPLPEYTVEIYFSGDSGEYEAVDTVLNFIRYFRNDLFLVLGVSLLIFAITAVFLCVCAGHRTKEGQIHAGGLNCLPLDLYLGLGITAIAGLAVAGVEGTEYLLRKNLMTGCAFGLAAAFLACLTVVGFCFAFVAQVKTPGGYWWRNTLVVRYFVLMFRVIAWLEKWAVKLFPWLGKGLRALWDISTHAVLAVWRFLAKLVKKTTGFLGGVVRRYFALLPFTWQWMVAGFLLVFVITIATATGNALMMLICMALAVAIVLYVAHCFGALLESTKRMSKGDLDSKVDDKLLVGCFQEFAGDLNDLADVAMVAAQKQLKSERMKTELITNVSHDIKTPLTSIINYVDLLQKPHTEEEGEAYLEVLDRQSQRLKKLIEDLMDMSKASTGNMSMDLTVLDAVECVNQALGEFGDKLDRAQLIPVFRHGEESARMIGDGRLVWRVLSNVLGNAVKYAMPGTRLYIDLQTLEGKVVISLKNISRDELNVDAEELMERFVRGDDSRNTEGSGLGLNIAKSLMELQKGQLQLLVDGDLFKVTLIFPGA